MSSNTSSGVCKGCRSPSPLNCESSVAITSKRVFENSNPNDDTSKARLSAPGVTLWTLPDQEQVFRVKLDARDLVRIQCRSQRVIVQLEIASQQIPFSNIGIAEQHHLGIDAFNRYQRPMGELKTLDHFCPLALSTTEARYIAGFAREHLLTTPDRDA